MREKNGFIATSILYAFLLSFLTLFLAYMANYIQNKQLLDQVKLMAQDEMETYNNTYLSNLEIGDYAVFDTISRESDTEGKTIFESLISDNSRWILFDISGSGNTRVYSFVSDINAQKYGKVYNFIPEVTTENNKATMRTYPDGGGKHGFLEMNLTVMRDYMLSGVYYKPIGVYYTTTNPTSNNFSVYRYSFPYALDMCVEFLNDKHLEKIFNTHDDSLMNAILNQEGKFLYWDTTRDEYGAEKGYTLMGYHGFAGFAGDGITNGSDPGAVNNSCKSNGNLARYENGKITIYNQNDDFRYAHLNKDSEHIYVDYCYYKDENFGTCSPDVGEFCFWFPFAGEKCFSTGRVEYNDAVCTSSNGEYPMRFVINLTVDESVPGSEGYIDSGNGTAQLPYLITSGIRYGGYDEE